MDAVVGLYSQHEKHIQVFVCSSLCLRYGVFTVSAFTHCYMHLSVRLKR